MHVVDNRTLLLGIDELYRVAMMRFEISRLLGCAERVAQAVNVTEDAGPVEGYYTKSPELTRYFRLMRALQRQPLSRRAVVNDLDEFQLLLAVTSSPLYGRLIDEGVLLPQSRDSLFEALARFSCERWNVVELVQEAHKVAIEWDDISLVGLAARIQDPVVLAAVRESVVLYAKTALGGLQELPELVWNVDDDVAVAANRFIRVFNQFVPSALPVAEPARAGIYYRAFTRNVIRGRCVRIGTDLLRHYHWAIKVTADGEEVEAFWNDEIWTTERYQREQQRARSAWSESQ